MNDPSLVCPHRARCHGAFHGKWSECSLTHGWRDFVFKKPARRSSLAFLTTNPSGMMGLRIPWTRGKLFIPTGRPSNAGNRACGLPPNTLASRLRIRVRVPILRTALLAPTTPPAFSFGKIWLRLFDLLLVCSQCTTFLSSGDANVCLWPDFCTWSHSLL